MSSSSSTSNKEMQIFGLSLGAEPKKVIALGVLLVVLVVVYLVMRDPSDPAATAAAQQAAAKTPPALKGLPDPDAVAGRTARRGTTDVPGGPRRQGSRQALTSALKEFKVSLKPDKENPIDPSRTDPTIRFTELARVQAVGMAGGGRSLFDFGAMTQLAEGGAKPATIVKPAKVIPIYGPSKPEPIPPPPPPPPPPAIPLKFYGFVNSARNGDRRAFFMENEDIYIASEGEMIKKRYKLVRIGVNSAVLEDTQYKNNQQTIKLEVEAQSTTP